MSDGRRILITGARKGIGRYLAGYYCKSGFQVIGCSRSPSDLAHCRYHHFELDICDEDSVNRMFSEIRKSFGGLDVLVNNAGIASMNHVLATPLKTASRILETNVSGTFLMCREAAKLMMSAKNGRIINFATVATPLRLEGEAIYAASKSAVITLTQILARELGSLGITVNAIGPTPVRTDLIAGVPESKLQQLLHRQALPRFAEFHDISNVIDFFMREESGFVTGQTIFLGGVS
ncbi:MAG: SDR family NAD(P)-dependent oxidoreductase [Candidatus Acidiferrales bacterium]